MAKKAKKLSIDDLLAALKDPAAAGIEMNLSNSKEVWAMIGNRDFDGLATQAGIKPEEVNDFIKSWIDDNPYTAIA